MLLGAGAILLAAFSFGVPVLFYGVTNSIILLAVAIAWSGTRQFYGRSPMIAAAAAGPLIWTFLIPFADSPAWLAIASSLGTFYTLATAYEFWRARDERLPSLQPSLILQSIHGFFYILRIAAALTGVNQGPWTGTLLSALVLEITMHAVGMGLLAIALVKERTELRSGEQLRALALQDGLTGIGNRRHFDERMKAEIIRARREGSCLALVLLDVDHFKLFNDAYGHLRGDACLRMIAHALRPFARRPGDMVARYGGEEFAVLLPNTDVAGAVDVAEAIRLSVRGLGVTAPTPAGVVTISAGVATTAPQHDYPDPDALMMDADTALYEAKRAGRDIVRSAWQTAAFQLDSEA